MSVPNMEEAASIAAEYVSSLENLPSEIQFLLAEIRHKDIRCQEIQQEIHKETSKYVRHALRNPGSGAPNPKDAPIPAKVAADHATLATLGQEKLALAARVVRLVQRARARLDHDLARMLVLQGELDPADQAAYAAGELTGRNAAQSLTDSLRLALAPAEPVLALPAAAQTAGAPATKRRKVAAGASMKVASPAPSVGYAAASQRGRQQASARASPVRGRRGAAAAAAVIAADTMSVGDEDAEGEEDIEEGADEGDQEDQTIYCFCQQKSYGEMIACDNQACAYQWFHLECVNLAAPLPDHWYCRECVAKGFAPRKGRKK